MDNGTNFTSDIDFSTIDFINTIWLVKPLPEIIIESTVFIPVVIFGVFGNILCLHVLSQNRHIRSPTNLLIGNMAAADLFSLLTHPWVVLTYDFFQNYQLGSFGCKSEAAFECCTLIASVISMSAISYDRLTAIALPLETRLRLSRSGAKVIMGIAWVCGLLISIPLMLFREYKERQWKNFLEKFCTEKVVVTNIYWHVVITVIVWIPLIIQLICYIVIYVKLKQYQDVVLRRLHHNNQLNYKNKAVKMMFAVISTFMICRLPFTGIIFYRGGKSQQTSQVQQNSVSGSYHIVWLISSLFIFINAALNPLIYGLTNEKIKIGFRKTMISKWLFPHKTSQSHDVGNKQPFQKTSETYVPKIKIFLIFKKKPKSMSDQGKKEIKGPYII